MTMGQINEIRCASAFHIIRPFGYNSQPSVLWLVHFFQAGTESALASQWFLRVDEGELVPIPTPEEAQDQVYDEHMVESMLSGLTGECVLYYFSNLNSCTCNFVSTLAKCAIKAYFWLQVAKLFFLD
jgi:hypothetical protein